MVVSFGKLSIDGRSYDQCANEKQSPRADEPRGLESVAWIENFAVEQSHIDGMVNDG
jgi:hypothetical protein